MMQLDNTKRRMIVIGIALVFILFGVAQAVFKFKISLEIVNQGSFILMAIAAWLLFSNRKPAVKPDPDNPAENAAAEESPGESVPGTRASVETTSVEVTPESTRPKE